MSRMYWWVPLCIFATLRQTNIAMENGPGLKMYFLLNIGIFQPAMLVYQRAVYFDGYHHHNHKKGTRRFCKEPIIIFVAAHFRVFLKHNVEIVQKSYENFHLTCIAKISVKTATFFHQPKSWKLRTEKVEKQGWFFLGDLFLDVLPVKLGFFF